MVTVEVLAFEAADAALDVATESGDADAYEAALAAYMAAYAAIGAVEAESVRRLVGVTS